VHERCNEAVAQRTVSPEKMPAVYKGSFVAAPLHVILFVTRLLRDLLS